MKVWLNVDYGRRSNGRWRLMLDASFVLDPNFWEKTRYETGGVKALHAAWKQLAADPIRFYRITGAFFPEMVREQTKDMLAERGITEEDLREMLEQAKREAESPSSKRH